MISVEYATADGASLAGHDYSPASGVIPFAPGQQVQSLSVALRGDDQNEDDEDFYLELGNPVNAALGQGRGRGGILNDDDLPRLSVGDATAEEGNTSSVPSTLSFEVRLSHPSSQPVSVYYTTAALTAQAARDYTTTSGTLTFAPGETSKTFAVSILGD